MYSRFPFSMENLPRHRTFLCLSLRFGTIFSALIFILYSVLSLAACTAVFHNISTGPAEGQDLVMSLTVTAIVTAAHAITLSLTALMLVGALREKLDMIKPWLLWCSIQIMVMIIVFVFYSTINVIDHTAGNSLLAYVVEFLVLMLRFYMLILVASYYKQLEDELDETEALNSMVKKEASYTNA